MNSSQRATVYMRQNNWPYKTGDPATGGNLHMAWFGMTDRQRRRWHKKKAKNGEYN